MSKEIIIAYLSSVYVSEKCIKKFVKNYKKFKPGHKHKLVICFKQLDTDKIQRRLKILKGIKHEIFIDSKNINDYDFGTLQRVCLKFKNKFIFWLNDHSYPVKNNWLKIFSNYMNKKNILASSASYSSHYSNSFTRQKNQSIINFVIKIIYAFFNFPKFPNPHFRTTNFLIYSNYFYDYIITKKIISKIHAHKIESGYQSLTNYFIKKNFDILVVNSSGKSFAINDFHKSETFAYNKFSKCLLSDKQTRNFSKLNTSEKKKRRKQIWGIK